MLNWWPIAIILIFSNGADMLTGWHATRNRSMQTQDVVTSKRASIGRGQHYFQIFFSFQTCYPIHEFCKHFNTYSFPSFVFVSFSVNPVYPVLLFPLLTIQSYAKIVHLSSTSDPFLFNQFPCHPFVAVNVLRHKIVR